MRTDVSGPRILRWLLWGVLALVAATVAVVAFVPDIEVRIPEDEVREAIEARLPLESGTTDLEITVTEADVDFKGDGGMAIRVELDAAVLGFAASGVVQTQSALRYEAGAFYLSDLRLDDIVLTPTLATRAKIATLKKIMETFLDELAAEIERTDGEEALAQFTEWRRTIGPTILAALDRSLGEVPVYRLDRSGVQGLVRLALTDLTFTDDAALATLSPARALIVIATFFICAVIAALLVWERIARPDPVERDSSY